MDEHIPTHTHSGKHYAGSSHGFFFDDADSNSEAARDDQKAFWDLHLKGSGGGPPGVAFPSEGEIVDEGTKALSSSYGWVVDQIQLEEAETGQVIASAYSKPFEDKETDNFIEVTSLSSEFVQEFIQWAAYCTGISLSPSKIGVSAPGLISEELNENSKKLIKKMRTKFIKLYSRTNEGRKPNEKEIPVQINFQRED